MKKKIVTKKYKEKLTDVFGSSSITFSDLDTAVERVKKIREEAFSLFKNREFYKAACFYKALLDHVLKYLSYVDDELGKLSDVVYEFIRYFSESVRNSEEIDKDDFFKQSIKLYIEEDLGFTDELSKMILNNISNENDKKFIEKIIIEKVEKGNLSTYNQNKVIELLLRIYRKFNIYDKYLETCELLSKDRWERYVKPSEIYETLGEYNNAIKIIEEGMKELPQHKDIFEKRYNILKNRILGY